MEEITTTVECRPHELALLYKTVEMFQVETESKMEGGQARKIKWGQIGDNPSKYIRDKLVSYASRVVNATKQQFTFMNIVSRTIAGSYVL